MKLLEKEIESIFYFFSVFGFPWEILMKSLCYLHSVDSPYEALIKLYRAILMEITSIIFSIFSHICMASEKLQGNTSKAI